MTQRKAALHAIAGLLYIAAVAALGGCGGGKRGKFTEEQMASLPFAPRGGLPAPSGGMVLAVGDDAVTVEQAIMPQQDLLAPLAAAAPYSSFEVRARPLIEAVVRDKVIDVLLYRKAKAQAPEDVEDKLDKAVEIEVNRLVSEYGNNYAEAQKAIAEMGFDWQEYRDYVRKLILVQSYVSSEIAEKEPISHDDLVQYYDRVKAQRFAWQAVLEFSVIELDPARLTAQQIRADAGETAPQAAMRLAQELRDRIRNGEDFGELARQYSHGHRAELGGRWRTITPGTGALAKPYDVFETVAQRLDVGRVSEPFESGGEVFLLKVEAKKDAGVEPFDKVQATIEKEVDMIKRKRRYDRFTETILRQADVRGLERFVLFCTQEAYRRFQSTGGASTQDEQMPRG